MNKKLSPGVIVAAVVVVLAVVALVYFKSGGTSHDADIRPTADLNAAMKAGKAPMPGMPSATTTQPR